MWPLFNPQLCPADRVCLTAEAPRTNRDAPLRPVVESGPAVPDCPPLCLICVVHFPLKRMICYLYMNSPCAVIVSLDSSFVAPCSALLVQSAMYGSTYLQSPPSARLRLFVYPYPPGLPCSINHIYVFLLPPAGFLCGCILACLLTSVVVLRIGLGQTPRSTMLHSVRVVGLLGMRAPARGVADNVVC